MQIYYDILTTQPLDSLFSYSANQKLQTGQVVKVPFRNKQILGIVLQEQPSPPDNTKIKEISSYYPFILPKNRIDFLNFVASYNLIPKGAVLKMMLPVAEALEEGINFKNSPFAPNQYSLSQEQLNVYQIIASKLENKFSATLLEGVTGSGKTEVFLKAVINQIAAGKQVLILLPEIVLTSQLIERFTEKLNFRPQQWHSGLTKKQRREALNGIITGDVKLVVGARSALFLPFKDLSLIVIDEEHDQSYKQEEGPIYHARDMGLSLAKFLEIPIILCSATPSIESIFNAKRGRLEHLQLKNRYSMVEMPEIKLVDLEKERLANKWWITNPLRDEIKAAIANGKQSLLFLNRRGYAPITICKNCDAKISCKNCNSYLVYHKSKNLLRCHHCGYSTKCPSSCPSCAAKSDFINVGLGVEKLVEEICTFIENPKIALLTSDTLSKRESVTKALEKINKGEVDIIVGTQLITKGLHFSKLHLVGVIDADASVIGGDIRALEKTYQLLHQVSGRAGRESDRGLVIVQTRHPSSQLMEHLIDPASDAFVEAELHNREQAFMPPYSRLVSIILSGYNELDVIDAAHQLAQHAPHKIENVTVMGPSPAPIFYLNRKFRYRFIVSSPKELFIQKIISQWLSSCKIKSNVSVKIDVDPVSFM